MSVDEEKRRQRVCEVCRQDVGSGLPRQRKKWGEKQHLCIISQFCRTLGWWCCFSAQDLRRLKSRCHMAAFSFGAQLIPIPSRFQPFVVAGLTTQFPRWLSPGVALSSLQPLSGPLHLRSHNAHYIPMPRKAL